MPRLTVPVSHPLARTTPYQVQNCTLITPPPKKTAALTVMFHPRALLLLLLVLLLSVYVILSKNSIFCLGFWPKADAKVRTIFGSHKLFGIFFAKKRNIFAYFDRYHGERGKTLYKLLRRRNGQRTAASIEEGGD